MTGKSEIGGITVFVLVTDQLRPAIAAATTVRERHQEGDADHPTVLSEYREPNSHASDEDLLDVCDDSDDVFADTSHQYAASLSSSKHALPASTTRQRVDSAGSSNNRKVRRLLSMPLTLISACVRKVHAQQECATCLVVVLNG